MKKTSAYLQLKNILILLETPKTFKEGMKDLFFCKKNPPHDLIIQNFKVPSFDVKEELTIFQLPSVFTPEDWSYTFYEGLFRMPREFFQGKTLAELGTGNGWISLIMAKHFLVQKIYGLDINPQAVNLAKINLYLNSFQFDSNGNFSPIVDSEGKTLLDRVEYDTSDLLGTLWEKKVALDCVIGCIPQVLSPSETHLKQISEMSTDKDLYDLSNYCLPQGTIEDHYGLGLVAKAVEQSLLVLKSSGTMIFNLGNRPGKEILEELFLRRGVQPKIIWQRNIQQALDTDIESLVTIEKNSSQRFEFFVDGMDTESICAHTARALQLQQKSIYHRISVYLGRPKNLSWLKNFYLGIQGEKYKNARDLVNLNYPKNEVYEEKIYFLQHLITLLKEMKMIPYGETNGIYEFRTHLSQYLQIYYHLPCTADHIIVAPSSRLQIQNILHILKAKKVLSTRNDFFGLPQDLEVFESPKQLKIFQQMLEILKPSVAIFQLSLEESKHYEGIKNLIRICKKNNCLLILDLSLCFELSSLPKMNSLWNLLKEEMETPQLFLIVELNRNLVYPDLSCSFSVTFNQRLKEDISLSHEVTFSRTSYFTQMYYSKLILPLLEFVINPSIQEIVEKKLQQNKTYLALDYGENELPAPSLFSSLLVESFVPLKIHSPSLDLENEIKKILFNDFNIKNIHRQIHFAQGASALFYNLAMTTRTNAQFLLPKGHYGYFRQCLDFFNLSYSIVDTSSENDFKYDAHQLKKHISLSGNKFLYLNFPIVNPTGAKYSKKEMVQLISSLKGSKTTLIIDTIFKGLEFDFKADENPYNYLGKILEESEIPWILFGGPSKEFSLAGIRFAYCAHSHNLFSEFNLINDLKPHPIVMHFMKNFYSQIDQFREQQKNNVEVLANRAKLLTLALRKLKWKVLEPQGGLFLIAAPPLKPKQTTKDFCKKLKETTGILINDDEWIQIPGYCRIVLSVKEEVFNATLKKFY